MNISEAIETVSSLKKSIERVDNALKCAEKTEYGGDPVRVQASVIVTGAGDTRVSLSRDACIKALQDTKANYEARIATLQPVIDMANAALKGLMK